MEDIKQVIVVRKDLKLRRSEIAAQVAHASMKFLLENNESERGDELVVKLSSEEAAWIQGSFKKIIVGVNSEEALKNLLLRAELAGIGVYPISLDHPEKEEEKLMCIALGPDRSEEIDQITGHLKLI